LSEAWETKRSHSLITANKEWCTYQRLLVDVLCALSDQQLNFATEKISVAKHGFLNSLFLSDPRELRGEGFEYQPQKN
jgi:hypothetical protein